MSDREAIVELVSRMGLLTDAREWEALEALFCSEIEVDYTSLNGGAPARLSPAELVGGWRENIGHLAATQHLIANHVVEPDGDEARVAANVTGTHAASRATGDALWTVGGRYDLRVRREDGEWRIAALTLTVRWVHRQPGDHGAAGLTGPAAGRGAICDAPARRWRARLS